MLLIEKIEIKIMFVFSDSCGQPPLAVCSICDRKNSQKHMFLRSQTNDLDICILLLMTICYAGGKSYDLYKKYFQLIPPHEEAHIIPCVEHRVLKCLKFQTSIFNVFLTWYDCQSGPTNLFVWICY